MPVSLEFMRGILGLIGIGCAFMMGRSIVAVRRGWQKQSMLIGWAVRLILCLGAVSFRHGIDAASLAVWALSAAACGLGVYQTSRQKKEEDLTKDIFPEQ
ncbi:MAG TPA: hypothetical protein VG456_09665 [Candidatus Sulfopaludibacter sp.]|jgi:hypothetical protein|nr:hypothetical protein [Candidatus Sulfopaludibacter sp.]